MFNPPPISYTQVTTIEMPLSAAKVMMITTDAVSTVHRELERAGQVAELRQLEITYRVFPAAQVEAV